MTEQTIVAVYDRRTDADAAVRDLAAASVPSQAISRHENGTETTTQRSRLLGRKGSGHVSSEASRTTTLRSMTAASRDGSSVVTVRVSSDQVDHISSILETHNPVDIEERSAQYTTSGLGTTNTMNPPSVTGSLGTAGSAHYDSGDHIGKRRHAAGRRDPWPSASAP